MSKGLIALAVIFGVVFIGYSWFVGTYNSLIRQSAEVDTAWASVETQYERRFALVPNLEASVKGALGQEREVFGTIAEARTRYAGAAAGSNERVEATAQYESALARLMVIIENYPQLRSIDTVNRFMDELAGTENRVLVARDRYNEQVRIFNVKIKSFPTNILADMFGYESRTFFKPSEGSQNAPSVDLTI